LEASKYLELVHGREQKKLPDVNSPMPLHASIDSDRPMSARAELGLPDKEGDDLPLPIPQPLGDRGHSSSLPEQAARSLGELGKAKSMPSRHLEPQLARVDSTRSELSVSGDYEYEDFGSAESTVNTLRKLLLADPFRVYMKTMRGKCPPDSLFIDNKAAVVNIDNAKGPNKEGTGSAVYFTEALSPTDPSVSLFPVAVKVLVRSSMFTYEGLRRERAFLEALQGLNGGTVLAHQVDRDASILPGCRAVVLVTDFAGATTIDKLSSKAKIALAAARSIEILRDLHNRGVLHGDIHLGNILVGDESNIETSTKLIDFGRAETYLVASKVTDDETGAEEIVWEHRSYKKRRLDENFSPFLLSIYELKGVVTSRRDDMYRLAEAIMHAVSDDPFKRLYAIRKDKTALIKAKEELTDPKNPIADAFLAAMRALKFKERPDYDLWIQVFRYRASSEYTDDPEAV
jgi:hypothetical protein